MRPPHHWPSDIAMVLLAKKDWSYMRDDGDAGFLRGPRVWPGNLDSSELEDDALGSNFSVLSGTLMACLQVSSVAALVQSGV